jgi:NACalpha-BTF3-like transcription factor
MTSDQEAKQLDSVTDLVQGKDLDENRTRDAISALSSSTLSKTLDSVLASVQVSKEDIAFIVNELEVTDEAAERALKRVIMGGIPQGQSALTAALLLLITS